MVEAPGKTGASRVLEGARPSPENLDCGQLTMSHWPSGSRLAVP